MPTRGARKALLRYAHPAAWIRCCAAPHAHTVIMSSQDAFERTVVSLYEAMLDDAHWPAAAALIDEACGTRASAVMVGEGPEDDVRVIFVGHCQRGQRRQDLERNYLRFYHAIDEMVPRGRRLPDSRLVHVTELYTADELKVSPTYNELLPRACLQAGLNVRMDGPDGCHIAMAFGDPVASDGWGSSQVAMVQRLLPHVRQFVRVRQALVRAEARGSTLAGLLENPRIGVLHLDRRGKIMAANDRAGRILQCADGLSDEDGLLRARDRADQLRLERLVAAALPGSGTVPVSGSMRLRRPSELAPFVLHVKPVSVSQLDYGARHVAAEVLIAVAGRTHRVDSGLVAETLGLTPAESRLAVRLAEGKSVRELAESAGQTPGAVYWHLKQIYQKLHISRQVDLVRLVLSVAEFG